MAIPHTIPQSKVYIQAIINDHQFIVGNDIISDIIILDAHGNGALLLTWIGDHGGYVLGEQYLPALGPWNPTPLFPCSYSVWYRQLCEWIDTQLGRYRELPARGWAV
jgi:hypothetical protein